MLPKVHCQCYEEFKQILEQLHVAGVQVDVAKLRSLLSTAQQFFQQQVLSLDADGLESADQSRVRSYQTEMSKQLQLLQLDVMFLQVARQQETAKTRIVQLNSRVATLIRYCDGLLESTATE